MFSSEVGLAASDQEEEHPKVIDAGLFLNHIFSVEDCKVIEVWAFLSSDEEEEHAEAQQEDGQDVQEDAGEAEASEEEGEVWEAAQGEEAASSLNWLLVLRPFPWCESVWQVLPTPIFRVPTDISYTNVLNNTYKITYSKYDIPKIVVWIQFLW